jgi:hypothetical protein
MENRWLGLRYDDAAAARSMAKAESVEEVARDLAGPIAGCLRDRLITSRWRFVLDPCFARGNNTGHNPIDRERKGSNHLDFTQMITLLDATPAMRGKPRRRRRRPDRALGDRVYDSKCHREMLQERGNEPFAAKRNTAHGNVLEATRRGVDRSVSCRHPLRRLR